MIHIGFSLFLAMSATGQFSESNSRSDVLRVTATVVRPIMVSEPVMTKTGAVILIFNTYGVNITSEGGVAVWRPDLDAVEININGEDSPVITLTY